MFAAANPQVRPANKTGGGRVQAWVEIGVGLVLLALGGEGVVRGAVGVARRLGVSELLIGLTLVGFGTSTPELLTSVNAALRGAEGVALGNVVGSNIANVLLIAAVGALLRPIPVARGSVAFDGAVMLAAAAGLAACIATFGGIGRPAGAVGLGLLALYLIVSVSRGKNNAEDDADAGPAPGLWLSLAFAVGGLAMLIFGADQLVSGAVDLARGAGISETVIGLTIVAVGTSLPELVATVAAALRGRSAVALGNVIGSNIYNVLGVLGATAVVRPISSPPDLSWIDWSVFVASGAMLTLLAWTQSRINRIEGLIMLGCYGLYIAYLVGHAAV